MLVMSGNVSSKASNGGDDNDGGDDDDGDDIRSKNSKSHKQCSADSAVQHASKLSRWLSESERCGRVSKNKGINKYLNK